MTSLRVANLTTAQVNHKDNSEKELSSSMLVIDSPSLPDGSRSIDDFQLSEPLPKVTYHQIRKAIEKNQDEIRVFFFKQNLVGSYPASIYMAELEAVCAAIYKFFAPHHIPNTHAVYDKSNTFVGVISEELAGFKTVAERPLTDEDLKTEFVTQKNLAYSELDELDERIRELEEVGYSLERKYKKLEENEKTYNAILASKPTETLNDYLKNTEKKVTLIKEKSQNALSIATLYNNIEKKYHITKTDFENYRTIKGLALCLTASYILMEDDLHQNNLSKDGKRIDFDMSLWPLLYTFCDKGYIDSLMRKPAEKTFAVTAEDISHFPNLSDSSPFYWPTQTPRIFTETTTNLLKQLISFSSNAFPQKTNATFQKLEKNDVFNHYKFSILLKFLLLDDKVFKKIALKHIRKEAAYESILVTDKIDTLQAERTKAFQTELIKLPEFSAFVKKHGRDTLKKAKEEAAKRNQAFLHIDESVLEHNYDNLYKLIEENEKKRDDINNNSKYIPYATVKQKVIATMEQYKSPGWISLGGFFRNHAVVADAIIHYSNELKPNPEYKEDNFEAIDKLKQKINIEKNKLLEKKTATEKSGEKMGEMFNILTSLLKDDLFQQPEAKEFSGLKMNIR